MVRVYPDLEDLSHAAARLIVDLAAQAVSQRGSFHLALSGGETPRRLYQLLATTPYREQIHWGNVHVFWGDERCVPPGDPRSNAQMARQALLDHVPIPPDQIHPIQGELPPKQAAEEYEALLRTIFQAPTGKIDLILLGLGLDAHTASLFPHSPVLGEHERWVAAVRMNGDLPDRVTLTAPLINLADQVVFTVSGAEKAQALHMVLEGPYLPEEYPAQLICPANRPVWLVDQAAGNKLSGQVEMESSD